MIPEDILKERLGARKIGMICEECSVSGGSLINDLFRLVNHPDSGISYNALWILSHLSKQKRGVAEAKRSELVNILLSEKHCGKRRMILNILNNLNWEKSDIRTDYLDYCLSKITSTEPYGIRALCMKQAFAQCRHYPELLKEFLTVIDMMEENLSPGLVSARKNIMKKINGLK